MHGGTLQNTMEHIKSKTTVQKVSGSNPLGRAIFLNSIALMLPSKTTRDFGIYSSEITLLAKGEFQ
jgi:hypothetical protein